MAEITIKFSDKFDVLLVDFDTTIARWQSFGGTRNLVKENGIWGLVINEGTKTQWIYLFNEHQCERIDEHYNEWLMLRAIYDTK